MGNRLSGGALSLGDSGTATNNFVLTASAANGTMKLARGNEGATTQDILVVAPDGKLAVPAGFGPVTAYSMVRVGVSPGYGSVNTLVIRLTTIDVNVGTDITYADSATAGTSFTINVSGNYAISANAAFAAAAGVGIVKNAVAGFTFPNTLTQGVAGATSWNAALAWAGFLVAGTVVRLVGDGNALNGSAQSFTISRVS